MAEDIRETMSRWVQLFNAGNIDAMAELIHDDLVDHEALPGQPAGGEGLVWKMRQTVAGLPDIQLRVEDQAIDGEIAASRIVVTGTHSGELFGMAPTGRALTFESMEFLRFRDGKIIENRSLSNLGAVMAKGAEA